MRVIGRNRNSPFDPLESVRFVAVMDPTDADHPTTAESTLVSATRRTTAKDAIAWIAEGHTLSEGVALHDVVRALLAIDDTPARSRALARMASEITASDLDPAAVLHEKRLIPNAGVFRQALDTLAEASGGSLARVTSSSLRLAQSRDGRVMETLEAMVGVTHRELRERVAGLPREATGAWTNAALNSAFKYLDALTRGALPLPDAADTFLPAPVELMPEVTGPLDETGWRRLEELRVHGMPYELMLAQRVVGSAWGQHRNRTSQAPMTAVAQRLESLLRLDGFDPVLSDKYGGAARQRDLAEMVGGDSNVNMVVRTPPPHPVPFLAVTFSLAKDGGSARKTLAAKLQMDVPSVPVFVVVLGAGFAQRNETVALVEHFAGQVFTERTLNQLVSAAGLLSPKEPA